MKRALFFWLLTSVILSAACSTNGMSQMCNKPSRHIDENQYFHPLWSKSNFYVLGSQFDPMIQGLLSYIFVASQEQNYGSASVVAIDVKNGALIWRQTVDLPVSMLTGGIYLYLGENDKLIEYDPATGKPTYEKTLSNTGPIYGMYFSEGKLFALTGSSRSITYNLVSRNVVLSQPYLAYTPFVVQNGILYLNDLDGYKAQEVNTQKPVWKYTIDEDVQIKPLFTENMMIILSRSGNIYAINKRTGILSWKSEAHAISNVAADASRLYFLATEGSLEVVDEESGRELQKMEFSSNPFLVSTPSALVGGFDVWVDSQNKIVIASLGDSCQLVALKIQDQ